MAGGAGSGKPAALAVLSKSDDPVAPTNEAPARVAAPLKNSRLSTKLLREGIGSFSLGMVVPAFLEGGLVLVFRDTAQPQSLLSF
jgi:hypothetical protein